MNRNRASAKKAGTAEEVREYWRDVERELDRAEMDRPQEGEE